MILITGADGQLGFQLKKIYSNQQAYFAELKDLDITNSKQVEDLFKRNKFSGIINCAAFTAVDLAESQPEQCYQVNSKAVETLAKLSASRQIPMVHISTDYVFDGVAKKPYVENDKTNPLSVYGKSKLEGENKFLEYAFAGVIIRTSWLYSEFGKNFYLTMSRLMKEKEAVNVVCDQIGTPTYAYDLSKAIQCLLDGISNTKEVFHFSNEGVTTWYDFACEIARERKLNCKITPISTKEYPLPAKRPAYSVFDKTKIKPRLNFQIRNWKLALKDCVGNS